MCNLFQHLAARLDGNKRVDITKYLINKGADIYDKNASAFHKSPLHLAVEKSFMDTIEIFLNKLTSCQQEPLPPTSGKKASSSSSPPSASNSALYDPVSPAEIISSLYDSNGESPLHYAARQNRLDICERLLFHGFDLNVKSSLDKYPHELCSNESLRKYLYEKFQLKCKQTDFDTDVQLLLEASKSDDLEVVKVNIKTNKKAFLVNFFFQ